MAPSHEARFTWSELLRCVGGPLVALSLFAGAMHLGAALGLLPPPRPALDVDRAILIHQAEASRRPQEAALVLLGDSSCLMDVSAVRLGERLGCGALNLGTLSYLDLPAQGSLLQAYVAANPGRLRMVVLLMHPTALRLQDPPGYYTGVLRDYWAGREHRGGRRLADRLEAWCGLTGFRERFVGRWLPIALPGDYGPAYGFTTDLWRQLTAQRGSLLDPGRFDARAEHGSAEYRLARRFEAESFAFRASVPTDVRLAVGITPTPASLALPNHAATCERMLHQWGEWIQADVVLTNLPAVMPQAFFASDTHLNAAGVRQFTDALAAQLKALGD